MLHDLRVAVPLDACHYIVHHIAQRQLHFMGPALSQHFGQVALWVYIHQQHPLAVHCQPCTQVIYRSAFSDTACVIEITIGNTM